MNTGIVDNTAIARAFDRIVEDEAWQAGYTEEEIRIMLSFAHDHLILAFQNGWDLDERIYKILRALKAFRESE